MNYSQIYVGGETETDTFNTFHCCILTFIDHADEGHLCKRLNKASIDMFICDNVNTLLFYLCRDNKLSGVWFLSLLIFM